MTKQEVEQIITGIEKDALPEWKELQRRAALPAWDPNRIEGTLVMPPAEVERRKQYRQKAAEIFRASGIDEKSFPEDSWLCRKIASFLNPRPWEK